MPAAAASLFLCVVALVHDGDTFRCQDQTWVRTWGYNAPELNEPFGTAARDRLRQLADGQTVACTFKELDRYGRTVAQCGLDGQDLGHVIVREGLGRDWPRYSKRFYRDDEIAAACAGIGQWQQTANPWEETCEPRN